MSGMPVNMNESELDTSPNAIAAQDEVLDGATETHKIDSDSETEAGANEVGRDTNGTAVNLCAFTYFALTRTQCRIRGIFGRYPGRH